MGRIIGNLLVIALFCAFLWFVYSLSVFKCDMCHEWRLDKFQSYVISGSDANICKDCRDMLAGDYYFR